MTAEELILIPKHLNVKEQPHAARVFHDDTIEHKNGQIFYLNRLRPQLAPQTVRLRRKHLRKMLLSSNKNSLNC